MDKQFFVHMMAGGKHGTIYTGAYLDRDAIAFVFLIAVLMVRPQGLFAAK